MDESEKSTLSTSLAFKEYAVGRSKKVKPPWITIISTGLAVGLAYILTEIFAALVLKNAYALNFVLGLYGIPAGFICGWKNKNLSALTSIRYASFSALISVGVFGLISAFFIGFSAQNTIGLIVGFVELLIALVIVAVFSICVTFAIGAVLGTFSLGVHEAKK